jgi:hypothetical protein
MSIYFFYKLCQQKFIIVFYFQGTATVTLWDSSSVDLILSQVSIAIYKITSIYLTEIDNKILGILLSISVKYIEVINQRPASA